MQADEQGPYNYGMKKIRIVVMWWFQRGVGGENERYRLLESAVAFSGPNISYGRTRVI